MTTTPEGEGPRLGIPDTVDRIDFDAPDPEPGEVAAPDDPSYVEPALIEDD
jgi:hypothetical protein